MSQEFYPKYRYYLKYIEAEDFSIVFEEKWVFVLAVYLKVKDMILAETFLLQAYFNVRLSQLIKLIWLLVSRVYDSYTGA